MRRLVYALLALLAFTSVTGAQETPTPILSLNQPITIDGDASDWPIPASVFLESKDGKAQMRFASTYHDFYALVEVQDASPMKNGADRPEEMFKGGDTLAFYFQIEKDAPQRIAACWRNGKPEVYVYRETSDTKKPYTFSSPVGAARFDYVAPVDKAKVAFTKHEGEGYVMEIALPWRDALGHWPHQPDTFRFDAQVVFSDPGGTQNVGAAWLVATDGPGLTIEDLPTEARLYPDSWGDTRFVHTLTVQSDKPRLSIGRPTGGADIEITLPREGRLTVNITDRDGWILRELVMADKYAAGTHTIHWDGRDRYGEPLPAGAYLWKALLFDGMKTTFMGSVGNSGRPPYRTPDGLGSMGGQHGNMKSVAMDEGGVYMANAYQEGPPVMRKIDPVTGKALWMRSAGGFKGVQGIAAGDGMACFINDLGSREEYACDLVRIDPENGHDVPMQSGWARVRLAETQGRNTRVAGIAIVDGTAWLSITEKNLLLGVDLTTGERQPDRTVPAPKGLARMNDNTLLVCSAPDLLAVNLDTGSTSTWIAGLEEPRDVCLDADGNIYIAELGTHQQVRKFSPDGKQRLAIWGKEGGKADQQIPYDPMAFRNITNLVVGPRGNLWLAESDGLIRRTIKLAADGTWLEDFYGPVAYNTFGPDLDDFANVYYTISGARYIQTRLDYDQYRKNPTEPAKGWRVTAIHDMALAADGTTRNEPMAKIAATGYGHVIVFRGTNGHRYFLRFSEINRATAPLGAGLWIERDGRWVPCALIARDTKNHKSWADRNGDGLIQPEEEYDGLPLSRVAWIDRDLTLRGFPGILAPASVSSEGVPLYKGGTFASYLHEGEEDYFGSSWTFVAPGEEDTAYYVSNVGPHRHLSFWDRATENRVIKIDEGKVQWMVGQHDARPRFVELSTNSGVAGVQDGVLLVQNIEPCNYVAFTEDGFVLGDIMVDEEGRHPHVGPYVINIESFTGLYLKDPKTGRNILFAVSSGDNRILEVTGPGRMDRMQGGVTLETVTPCEPEAAHLPYSTWYGNTDRGLGVDGEDTEWRPEVRRHSLMKDGQVFGDIKLRRDAGNLYLYASLLDTTLEHGDRLTFRIADNAAGRKACDLTLTLAERTRKKGREEIKYLGAVAEFTCDGIPVTETNIDTAVSTRWRGLGYRIEAEIPLSLLPSLTEERAIEFRRRDPEKKGMGTLTDVRPDLKGPVFVDVLFHGATLSVAGHLKKAALQDH